MLLQFFKVLFSIFTMFGMKANCIVGITTYYNEYLGLSIPGLGQFNKKIILIIHNDNPDTIVTAKDIRNMGYNGALHIINSKQNLGMRDARLNILDFVKNKKLNAPWFVFLDDDDMLIDLDTPELDNSVWAIVQNTAVIKTRLIDVLRVFKDVKKLSVDGKNIKLIQPNVGLAGTMVRTDIMQKLADVLNQYHDEIADIDSSVNFRPPTDAMMWSALNIIARHSDKYTTPIYMDKINYVAINIDTASEKYGMPVGPTENQSEQIKSVINRYDSVIAHAMENAAPRGHDSEQ